MEKNKFFWVLYERKAARHKMPPKQNMICESCFAPHMAVVVVVVDFVQVFVFFLGYISNSARWISHWKSLKTISEEHTTIISYSVFVKTKESNRSHIPHNSQQKNMQQNLRHLSIPLEHILCVSLRNGIYLYILCDVQRVVFSSI